MSTIINFIEDKEWGWAAPITEGPIILDPTDAVPRKFQTVWLQMAAAPKIQFLDDAPLKYYGHTNFEPGKLMQYVFYLSDSGKYVLMGTSLPELPVDSQTAPPFLLEEFNGATFPNYMNKEETPECKLIMNGEGQLVFNDVATRASGMGYAKFDNKPPKQAYHFATEGKRVWAEIEIIRTEERPNFSYMLRGVDNTANRIVVNDNAANGDGLSYKTYDSQGIQLDHYAEGSTIDERIAIELADEKAKFYRFRDGNWQLVIEGAFKNGTYRFQGHRSGDAVEGHVTMVEYVRFDISDHV